MTRNVSRSRFWTDLPLKPGTPSSSFPPALVQPSPHPGWPESHLKLWNCIPFSGPIDSGAVSKTNGGFRKSILMKEKEQRKERYLEKGGGKRTGGGPLKVAMKGKKHREWGKGEKERSRAGICVCVCVSLLNVCVKLCVRCVIPSALKVGDGWAGLI